MKAGAPPRTNPTGRNRPPRRTASVLLLTLGAMSGARAQDRHLQTIQELEASVPAPAPADVSSPDAILAAIYDSISGPAGPRNWNRFRSLLVPHARLSTSTVDAKGVPRVRQLSVDEYIAAVTPIVAKEAFYESSIVNNTQRFGNIAQVFTSYASRHGRGEKPFQTGINSMQLMFDGTRWWVVSILWDATRPGNPLPKAMGG